MLYRLGRPVLMAAVLAVGVAGGQSAQAGFSLSLDLQSSPGVSNSGAVSVTAPSSGAPASGAVTYLIGLDQNGKTLVTTSTSPGTFYEPSGDHGTSDYFYSVTLNYSETDTTTGGTATAKLVDVTTTVSKSATYSSWAGNYSGPNPDPIVVIQLGYDQFTAPTGSNLKLQTALTVSSITGGGSKDYPNGSGDEDTITATGQFGTITDVSQTSGSQTDADQSKTDNGNVVTLSNTTTPFTLYNIMSVNLGGDADTAQATNTVTLSGPAPAAPEPSTTILAASALGTLALVRLRRRKAGAAA